MSIEKIKIPAIASMLLIHAHNNRLKIVLLMVLIATASCQSRAEDFVQVSNRSSANKAHALKHQINVDFERQWVVNGVEAKALIEQGATVLDARGTSVLRQPPFGSHSVTWQQFSQKSSSSRGKLLTDDDRLSKKLQTLGISHHKPIVVFANAPEGWGEDGRIVWMLRTLGHQKAVLVDGGLKTLQTVGLSSSFRKPQNLSSPGDFMVQRTPLWDIHKGELKQLLGKAKVVIIDSRTPEEYQGQTPHGETRGGHVPNAINLHFQDFLDQEGKLLPSWVISAKLKAFGITPNEQIVVYCTGGIRSAWLTSLLVNSGYNAKNYAGSMWEWSAQPENLYPLE